MLLHRLLAHANALGWAGVDLFFVLSGFLITGILLDERSRPRYFRTFFARRVLRIVPVYVAFLLFSMWVAPLLGLSTSAEVLHLRELQAWYWTYLLNIYVAIHGWAAVLFGAIVGATGQVVSFEPYVAARPTLNAQPRAEQPARIESESRSWPYSSSRDSRELFARHGNAQSSLARTGLRWCIARSTTSSATRSRHATRR